MESTVTRAPQQSRYYAPGELIAGKYELVRPLGEGGMGTVWVARNTALDTEVALKLIRAEVEFEGAGERLLQEARAAARLGHRAICRVFDFGHTEQGDPFIVMELLQGESLASLLETRGRLSATKAAQMLLPVIDALSAAHKRGIVHRDLKPENIFIARDGDRVQPKLVDFGIAKMESAAGAGRVLTTQGMVLGSPGYMSPEQARGDTNVDYRADIWSICVVLYEAVTGQAAFDGENYNALMRSIIEREPPSIVALAAGDAELARIVDRGLAKAPADRWASMGELASALAVWLDSHGVTHDLTGDGLGRWLAPPKEGDGDLLSGPPPSGDSDSSKRAAPAATHTLPAPAMRRASVPPESTAAMVSSSMRQRGEKSRLAMLVAGVGLVVLVVGGAVMLRSGDAAKSDVPVPAGAATPPAPVSAPLSARAEAPRPVDDEPAPVPSAAASGGPMPQKAPLTAAAPSERTSPKASRRPAAPKRVTAPKKATPSPGLKDPY